MNNKSEKWHALHAETAEINWKDLERFFAKGNLLRVSQELDLVDVALETELGEIDQVLLFVFATVGVEVLVNIDIICFFELFIFHWREE